MTIDEAAETGYRWPVLWTTFCVFAIAVNLRGALGSVPPLLGDISAELHLSGAEQGLLTSLAIVFMALSAPLGSAFRAVISDERLMSLTLAVLALGELMRAWAYSRTLLFVSVAIIGAAMGAGSTLVPALIARHLPASRGIATGTFAAGLALGVAAAAATANPLADWLGGWRGALAAWSTVTLLALAAWEARIRGQSRPQNRPATGAAAARSPLKSGTAWLLTLYTATPMVIGFTALAWTAPFYASEGYSDQGAANRVVIFQLVQLISMIGLPVIADSMRDSRSLLAAALGTACVGLTFLIVSPVGLDPFAVTLLGLGVGGNTALGLSLIPAISASPAVAGRLSAMVFTTAFTLSAAGPVAFGALKDLASSYAVGFGALLALGLSALAAIPALKPGRTVGGTSGNCQRLC